MRYLEAKQLFNEIYWSGRNSGKPTSDRFPFGLTYVDENFVEVEFPLSAIDPKPSNTELLNTYAECWQDGVVFPPIFVSAGRLLKDGQITPSFNN